MFDRYPQFWDSSPMWLNNQFQTPATDYLAYKQQYQQQEPETQYVPMPMGQPQQQQASPYPTEITGLLDYFYGK